MAAPAVAGRGNFYLVRGALVGIFPGLHGMLAGEVTRVAGSSFSMTTSRVVGTPQEAMALHTNTANLEVDG
eukprot:4714927-Amphidinium_carterae.1